MSSDKGYTRETRERVLNTIITTSNFENTGVFHVVPTQIISQRKKRHCYEATLCLVTIIKVFVHMRSVYALEGTAV